MSAEVVPFGPPVPIAEDSTSEQFWRALKDGVLTAQRCVKCRTFRMPPSPYCPQCLSNQCEWPRLSGAGVLYSYTVCLLQPKDPQSPVFIPGLVSLPEADGVRLYANIVSCNPRDLRIDMPVYLRPDLVSGAAVGASILFSPARPPAS